MQQFTSSGFLTSELDVLNAILATEEDREHEYHCRRMVNFRRKKKQERKELNDELRRLQRAMKMQEDIARSDARIIRQSRDPSVMTLLREVIVEKEALLAQNMALRKEIQTHTTFYKLLQEEPQCNKEYQSQSEKATLWPSVDQEGWRVHIPDGEQSFYFHPFSREQFDAFPNPFDPGFFNESLFPYVETFLGWKAYQVLPPPDKPLLVRVQCTKRLQCSVEEELVG
ncbi:hypothetical protein PHYBOEH_001271 [Phytophthora boehmeriae]|uniref:Uncharacterized protein n=1 Tax=Phytophthora boehmeriae TaxID=109152 RepID=A0A8T1V9S5_9STRA|nr:hypothetical protein PHYBOEH_001271 [Phytophthora boehmeriae]